MICHPNGEMHPFTESRRWQNPSKTSNSLFVKYIAPIGGHPVHKNLLLQPPKTHPTITTHNQLHPSKPRIALPPILSLNNVRTQYVRRLWADLSIFRTIYLKFHQTHVFTMDWDTRGVQPYVPLFGVFTHELRAEVFPTYHSKINLAHLRQLNKPPKQHNPGRHKFHFRPNTNSFFHTLTHIIITPLHPNSTTHITNMPFLHLLPLINPLLPQSFKILLQLPTTLWPPTSTRSL